MALSGSTNYPVTRDLLIGAAMQHISALGDGETPNGTQISEASFLLNLLIKNWQTDGMQLWMTYYGYIFPVSGVAKCSLGAEGGKSASSYLYTTTSAASVSGASTITVTTVAGIATTNIIGIELSTGAMQWTTVNGAPAGSVVTLTNALTGAVAVGASVYVYATTAQLTRPQEITLAFIRKSSDNTDVPLSIVSIDEYNNLADKFATGQPNQVAYDKVLGLGTSLYPGNGDLYFWPLFDNGGSVIVIKYVKLFDDLDIGTNNPEFPQAWFLPLMLGLAWLLSPKNGIPLNERKLLLQEAEIFRDRAIDNDIENTSVFLSPTQRQK